MDKAPKTSEIDFELSVPDMLLTNEAIQRVPEILRAIRELPASVRKHPEFEPWALLLQPGLGGDDGVHLRGALGVESLQVRAWLQSCFNRAMVQVASTKLVKYSDPDRSWYEDLAKTSANPQKIRQVAERLAEVGICLVVNHSFPVTKVDGAAFLLVDGTPVVALSLRYSREDSFWFTLFHELAHVKFDLKNSTAPIVDDLDVPSRTDREIIADDFALQSFVPNHVWRSLGLRFQSRRGNDPIYSAAAKLSISPAVVAGRLRRELNDHTLYAEIVKKNDVRRILE